ncbi:MAG TPA: hypothetical protein PK542_00815 [Treponemataceae bacterium]|nr:hypothetical protein [Treponemataceae bacterium]HPS43007.1 hypothetical protein [Treponemataceae bacterium]
MDSTMARAWRALACAAFAVIMALPAAAQFETETLNTRQYRWMHIETDHYDVIFPDALETQGRYVASALEAIRPLQESTMKPIRPYRFPVIINPDQISPNGYVSVIPRRSVFYTVPGTWVPGDWFTLLATHEGRHMFQFDELNQGVIHAISFLFGEYGAALVIGVPGWWLEGDAVMAETVLSDTGRGRSPRFTAQTKALFLDGKEYSYNKMLLGSYRAYTPNAYEFGYLMYSYLRSQYDPKAPATLLSAYARCPIPALGPHLATRKAAGKGASAVYREMAARYGAFWKAQVAALNLTPATPLAKQGRSAFRRHDAIAKASDGSVVAAVTDLEGNADIVSIRDGKETRLCRGYPANSLDAGGNLVVWDEIENEAKFDQGFSRIMLLDLKTGDTRALYRHSKYIYPAISRDGATLAFVEFSGDQSSSLVLASAKDGAIERKIAIPKGEIWIDLSFSADGKELVFVSSGISGDAGNRGKYIGKLSLEKGSVTVAYDARWENVMTPAIAGNTIFYVSNFSGIDSVWAIDPDGKRYEVVSRPIGSYCPKPDDSGNGVLFVDYANSRGTVVSRAETPRETWVPLERVTVAREDFFAKAAADDPGRGKSLPENFPITDKPAERYSPALQGNRIDAWGVIPATNGDVGITAFARADNVTGLMAQQLSLAYDYTDSSLGGFYQYRYRGFWPDLVFQAGSTFKEGEEASPSGSVAMEFPFAGGAAVSALWNATLGVSGGGTLDDGEAKALVTAYGNATARAGRWSLSLVGSWSCVATEGLEDNHPYGYAAFALPGVFARDSLTLKGSYERRHDGDDPLTLAYARGYYETDALEAWKSSAEYSVPLCYPDFAVGSLLYFNMIDLRAFYDFRRASDIDEDQMSAGAELLFHFMPLQIPYEINAGFRYSHKIAENEDAYDIVIMGMPIASF